MWVKNKINMFVCIIPILGSGVGDTIVRFIQLDTGEGIHWPGINLNDALLNWLTLC
jgi:hypothetical protein